MQPGNSLHQSRGRAISVAHPFALNVEQMPRRSREVTHFCSVRVTHQKCGLLIRKSIARVALSSAPKACRWINSHEHTRYVEFSNMQSCERRSRGRQAVRPQSLCIFYALRREAISLSGGRSRPLLSREHTASLELVGWMTAVICRPQSADRVMESPDYYAVSTAR